MKKLTTISIDSEIKLKAQQILKAKGSNLSRYVEQCLQQLIEIEGERL